MAEYINREALLNTLNKEGVPYNADVNYFIVNLPAADVVEVDKVAEMLQFIFGNECACNYGGIDEWLPWTCKYAETECPEPKEKFACWKEFIKAFIKRMNKERFK